MNMLDFLMENEAIIKSTDNGNYITADEYYELGGEFVVCASGDKEIYRCKDFDTALKVMQTGEVPQLTDESEGE